MSDEPRKLVERYWELDTEYKPIAQEHEAIMKKITHPGGALKKSSEMESGVVTEYHAICRRMNAITDEQDQILGSLGWWLLENIDNVKPAAT